MTEFEIEQEKNEILRRYRRLLRYAKPFLQDDDAKIIKRAFHMSQEAHKNMRRRSGEPYIFHPLAVAQICVEEIGLGTTSIVAALLHDVVEDTEMEVEDIERHFWQKGGPYHRWPHQDIRRFRPRNITTSKKISGKCCLHCPTMCA
jgi:guanosine-3',5'-bis(diphosphate) 3'-pyrophosphohydrolase